MFGNRRRSDGNRRPLRRGGGGPEAQTVIEAGELVEECQAFLAGHLVEEVERHAGLIPIWAWMNLLAHGSPRELWVERATLHPGGSVAEASWHEARSYLAGEILDAAAGTGDLTELQARVLVPLELQLAVVADTTVWEPGQWVELVQRVLGEQHRRADR